MPTATEFGYNDNPELGGYTEANWNVGAWGDDISTKDIVGVALRPEELAQHFGSADAAHNQLVRVTNNDTGKSVVARVVDKGPGPGVDASIDLTYGAARAIGSPYNSTSNVTYEFLGEKGVSGALQHPPGESPVTSEQVHALQPLPDSPEPEDEKPKEDKESPVQKWRKDNPQVADWDDKRLIDDMHAAFPEVPLDKFSVFAKQHGGSKMIRDYMARDLSPLEKFRKFYPNLATGDDDKDIEWMHSNLAPESSMAQFKADVNPPNPVLSFLGHAYDALGQSAVNLGKQITGKEVENPGFVAGKEAFMAKIDQLPQAAQDVVARAERALGVRNWIKDANKWLDKNVPAYGGAHDYFQRFVKQAAERGKQFEAQSAQNASKIGKDPFSQLAGTGSMILGQTPDVALSFGLGSVGRAAALWGMAYEGTSAYGHAVENHQKNALLQGVAAAGFRLFQQYMLNTGKGRIVSGVAMGLSGAADEELNKFLRGEPNDITKDGKTVAVNFLLGMLVGGKKPETAPASPPETGGAKPLTPGEFESRAFVNDEEPPQGRQDLIRREPPEPVDPNLRGEDFMSALERRQAPSALFYHDPGTWFGEGVSPQEPPSVQGEVKLGYGPENYEDQSLIGFGFSHHQPEVAEELDKAHKAQGNGDTDAAAQHIDKALVLMPDGQKRAIAQGYIDKVDELAGEKPKRAASAPEKELFGDYLHAGLPIMQAYEQLKKKGLGSAVFLSDLAKAVGLSMSEMQEWAKAAQAVGTANLDPGHWPTATDEQKSAAVMLRGEPRLMIRFPERAEKEPKGSEDLQRRMEAIEARERAEKEKPVTWKRDAKGNLIPSRPSGDIETQKWLARQNRDDFNDYYFAGIPMPKKAQEWLDDRAKDWEGIRFTLRPESTSPEAEVMGQIIKGEEAHSIAASHAVPQQIAREAGAKNMIGTPLGDFFGKVMGDVNKFRHGDRLEAMERYANNFTEDQQIKQLDDFQQTGKTAHPTIDWFFQNVMKPTYEAYHRREERYGVEYDPRSNYIYGLMKHPKDDMIRLREDLRKHGLDPNFVKPKQMRIAERIALGHRPITTNWVRLMQMRGWAHERVIQKIRDMREAVTAGLAFDKESKDVPEYAKQWAEMGTAERSKTSGAHKVYYVSPKIHAVLNSKFDSRDLFKVPIAGAFYAKPLSVLKGAVAAKVSWSLFHQLHVLGITNADFGALAAQRILGGKGTWASYLDILSQAAPVAGGIPRAAWAYLKYGDVVNALQGKADLAHLSPETIKDMHDVMEMGIVPEVNEERQMQFMKWIHDKLPHWARQDSAMGGFVDAGRKLLLDQLGFQSWWFGTVTPRLKVASALARRDALMESNPQLFQSKNRDLLLREYGNIHRDVEGRFGEMHYGNLLWPRMLKQFAQIHLLSFGWQLGMMRTMGDGVIDLTTNRAHISKLKAEWRERGLNPELNRFVTNRTAFQAMYLAQGFLTGWAISYLVGGKKAQDLDWKDGVYPVVGKDRDGKEKRVNMQYFFKEVPSFMEYRARQGTGLALVTLGMNKLTPMLTAVTQAAMNRDYMGHVIGDPSQRFQYLVAQGLFPISFENMTASGHQNWNDVILSGLGYTPSARWTMRSDWENRVLNQWINDKEFGPALNARDEYRQAVQSGDNQAMDQAAGKLRKMGTTEKSLENMRKNAHIPTAVKHFKELSKEQQRQNLDQMPPETRDKFLHGEWKKYVSPEVRNKL